MFFIVMSKLILEATLGLSIEIFSSIEKSILNDDLDLAICDLRSAEDLFSDVRTFACDGEAVR